MQEGHLRKSLTTGECHRTGPCLPGAWGFPEATAAGETTESTLAFSDPLKGLLGKGKLVCPGARLGVEGEPVSGLAETTDRI